MSPVLTLPKMTGRQPRARLRKSRLFVALSQTGKTTQMVSSLERIIRPEIEGGHEPITGVTVVDFKGSSLWLGLKHRPDKDGTPSFLWVPRNSFEGLIIAKAKLEALSHMLNQRAKVRMDCLAQGISYNPRPHILILEEWLIGLTLATRYDNAHSGGKKAPRMRQWFEDTLAEFLVSGLEDGLEVWISTQSPNVDKNGLDVSLRKHLIFHCFGSPVQDYEAIELALKNHNIVPSDFRKPLLEELRQRSSQKQWLMLSDDPAMAADPRLSDRPCKPWIFYERRNFNPRIKGLQLFEGKGSPVPSLSEFYSLLPDYQAQRSVIVLSGANLTTPEEPIEEQPEESAEDALLDAMEKLIAFTSERNGKIRLREAQIGLTGRWTIEQVKAAADYAVERGLATLTPKPKGSFEFQLINADSGDSNDALSLSQTTHL